MLFSLAAFRSDPAARRPAPTPAAIRQRDGLHLHQAAHWSAIWRRDGLHPHQAAHWSAIWRRDGLHLHQAAHWSAIWQRDGLDLHRAAIQQRDSLYLHRQRTGQRDGLHLHQASHRAELAARSITPCRCDHAARAITQPPRAPGCNTYGVALIAAHA